jgi:hypothetical protein
LQQYLPENARVIRGHLCGVPDALLDPLEVPKPLLTITTMTAT